MISPPGKNFRFRTFVGVSAIAIAVIMLVAIPIYLFLPPRLYAPIERRLTAEARLAAELLSRRESAISPEQLEGEARMLGRAAGARVSLMDSDGRVVADSTIDLQGLPAFEPESSQRQTAVAREKGIDVERQYNAALGMDVLSAVIVAQHPSVAFVRVTVSLTEVDAQRRLILQVTCAALILALGSAMAFARFSSRSLGRELHPIADGARRHAGGALPQLPGDLQKHELGAVVQVLDDSVAELGGRVSELDRDRVRLEAILAGMIEGVLVVDTNGRVRLVNDAAQRMLRLDTSAVGRHYLEAIRQPGIAAQLASTLGGNTPQGLEVSLGRGRTFVARAAPTRTADGTGAVLVLHDITDLRRADQIRRDFVANVSHELRTPLTAIRGYVEALSDDSSNAAERRRFLDIIARHASRMERMVQDLLRLARLEAGQEAIERQTCQVDALLQAVVSDLRPGLDARRLRVEMRVDPDLPPIVTDSRKLHNALLNLVENAMKYSPEGGAVILEAVKRDDGLVLSVADEGPGIPEGDLTRIFERFYRVDRARTTDSGGTGLGLSIVKHLVGRLDGRVDAENRATGGAIFTITLPFQPHLGADQT